MIGRLVFIVCFGLCSCSRTTDKGLSSVTPDSIATVTVDTVTGTPDFDYESIFKLDNYLTKITDGDSVQIVDFDCAILVYPTKEQVDEMIKTEGEDDFYVGADDSNWYQAQAIDTLDYTAIKTITALGQFLRLKGKERVWELDVRKKNLPGWNLIFFKTTKEPQIESTTDLTVAKVKDYFEIRE
jgi:hypothetical protein